MLQHPLAAPAAAPTRRKPLRLKVHPEQGIIVAGRHAARVPPRLAAFLAVLRSGEVVGQERMAKALYGRGELPKDLRATLKALAREANAVLEPMGIRVQVVHPPAGWDGPPGMRLVGL